MGLIFILIIVLFLKVIIFNVYPIFAINGILTADVVKYHKAIFIIPIIVEIVPIGVKDCFVF
jgi:hypothetical protein